MTPRSRRRKKAGDDHRTAADQLLSALFKQAKSQFGEAAKSFWFYDGDLCPGCLARPVGVIKMKGEDALAINAFIYRPRHVLIGYFLCEACASFIHSEAQRHPYQQTPLHAEIEQNLIAAYREHLASLDA